MSGEHEIEAEQDDPELEHGTCGGPQTRNCRRRHVADVGDEDAEGDAEDEWRQRRERSMGAQ
jgi:hypothetical protein